MDKNLAVVRENTQFIEFADFRGAHISVTASFELPR